MNRRECLATVVGGVAAAQVSADVQAVDSYDLLCLVVNVPGVMKKEERDAMREGILAAFKGNSRPPIIVLSGGVTIEAIYRQPERSQS